MLRGQSQDTFLLDIFLGTHVKQRHTSSQTMSRYGPAASWQVPLQITIKKLTQSETFNIN